MHKRFSSLKRGLLSLALGASVISFAPQVLAQDTLETLVTAPHRSADNIARNEYRHPVETLRFFDVQPTHNVIEINPGTGWYTEILGPYLKEQGALTLTVFADDSARDYAPPLNKAIKELTANKDLFGTVNYVVLDAPEHLGPLAPPASVDRVLTFRNVHSWMADDAAEKVFANFFEALKPGGILGVVEHRAKTDTAQDPRSANGYVREDYVIKLAEDAGFKLVEKSEINANPKDTADYLDGVWELPPRLRTAEENKEKHRAIGESDRMTLKFIKPAAE